MRSSRRCSRASVRHQRPRREDSRSRRRARSSSRRVSGWSPTRVGARGTTPSASSQCSARRWPRSREAELMAVADLIPLLEDRRAPTAKDDRCGCGCLIVTRESRRFTLPLRAVSFSARVAERVAEVTVEQTFENEYPELLEAVYIFPLAGGAAVSRFELHVDGKRLIGIVEERGEARRQYDEAIAQGKK